jgi:hypothetical protein
MKTIKKLSLSQLKVDSFVTSIDGLTTKTLKGGGTNDTVTIYTNQPNSPIIVIVSIIQKTTPPPQTDDTGGDDDTQANDATAGCCADNGICNTAAYCGNTHDGGNGCSYGSCM